MWCPNNVIEDTKTGQGGCQALCEINSACVGISYSHKIKSNEICYLCNDDTTMGSNNEFHFYRRPGIFEIVFSLSIISK